MNLFEYFLEPCLLSGLGRVSNERALVLVQSVHELFNSEHLQELLVLSLAADPHFIGRHLRKGSLHLTRQLVYLPQEVTLCKRRAPEEETVRISATNVAATVVHLPPFEAVHDFLGTQVSLEDIAVCGIDLNEWPLNVLSKLELLFDFIGLVLEVFEFVKEGILPQSNVVLA